MMMVVVAVVVIEDCVDDDSDYDYLESFCEFRTVLQALQVLKHVVVNQDMRLQKEVLPTSLS